MDGVRGGGEAGLSGPRRVRIALVALSSTVLFIFAAGCAVRPAIILLPDAPAGRLAIFVDGREALVYQYAASLDLPHYWPMRSPSGKNLLVQKTEPYPHHRAFLFADAVRPEGEREGSLYNALYSGVKTEEAPAGAENAPPAYGPPFRDRIRHKGFTRLETAGRSAVVEADLV